MTDNIGTIRNFTLETFKSKSFSPITAFKAIDTVLRAVGSEGQIYPSLTELKYSRDHGVTVSVALMMG